MKRLSTAIDIQAPPPRVWEVLVDLARYPEWNPFIVAAQGPVESGARLRLRLSPPGGRTVSLTPRVTACVPDELLEWHGRLAVPGLFAGRHRFELHGDATGTRLLHSESFTGILVPLLARSLDAHTRPGFEAMNRALKVEAEKLPIAAG